MNLPTEYRRALALLFLFVISSDVASADDWPQWRGPLRDGVWREKGVIEKFESKQLEPRWRVKIGAGYSGPTVANNRVFITDRPKSAEQVERVLCFDAKNGKKLWEHSYPRRYVKVGYVAGPRACVTVEDNRAFALGTMGDLLCIDVGGQLLWKKDLNAIYKTFDRPRPPRWGLAASPLVVGDTLIVQVGGADGSCLVGFDKKSGDEEWRALDDAPSYSAPILIQQSGRDVVVCLTGQSVAGVDAKNGKVYWRTDFSPRNMPIGVATPVVDSDRLFVTSFYDGSLLLRLKQDEPKIERLWRRIGANEKNTDALHCMISTPVLSGAFLYGVDSYGELRCLDAETGDRLWEDQSATPRARWSNIHIVRNGDRYWMFNERGELIIAKLDRKGFHEISRAKLIKPTTDQLRRRGGREGVTWAHPAYADRHVFIRNDEAMISVSLEAK